MNRAAMTPGQELGDFLRVLRRRKATILLVLLLVLGAALAGSWLQTPVYAAKAKVLLQPGGTDSVFNPNTGQRNDPARAVETEIEVMKSEPVRAAVRASLGVAPEIVPSGVGRTDVIQLVAESKSPTEAARVANAYAVAYIDFRRKQAVDDLLAVSEEIRSKVERLQQQIDEIDRQVDQAPQAQQATVRQNLTPQKEALVQQHAAFKQRLDQVQVDAALTSRRAQLVSTAATPSSPVRPTPVRAGALGFITGIILAVGLAFLFERLDDSVKTRDDLARATGGIPVVGTIPALRSRKRRKNAVVSLTRPGSPAAEAYRTVRTSLQFVGVDRPIRSLQVTSASAEESKTTTVANLAVALSTAGQRVLIVCCDLRRPRVHELFGLDSSIGLTSILVGDTAASEAVQPVPDQPGLWLLASGPLPPNPAEMLASRKAAEVLTGLAAEFDVLLVDCPPVLPVSDALAVSRCVDATLLVCLAGRSKHRQIERAVELLAQVDAPLVGTILTGATVEGAGRYSYYYIATTSTADRSNGDNKRRSRKRAATAAG